MDHPYLKFKDLIKEEIKVALGYTADELADTKSQKKRFQKKADEPVKVIFSRNKDKNPLGLVPMRIGNYRNRVLSKMPINEFLNLASDGGNVNNFIKKEILKGKPIAPPFLQVVYIHSLNVWYVYAHEGRSRAKTIQKMSEKQKNVIPVDLFLYQRDDVDSKRTKIDSNELDQNMIESFYKRVVPQDYNYPETEKNVNLFSDEVRFEYLNV